MLFLFFHELFLLLAECGENSQSNICFDLFCFVTFCEQAMDAMLDQVELTCEVSFAISGVIDKVEGEALSHETDR